MTSSEQRKCVKCEFTVPVSEWKNFRDGSRNPLCGECSYMGCRVCKYTARVREWRIEIDGVSSLRCLKCTGVEFNKCTRCEFEGPLSEWKMKKGVPTKWCNRCLEWARQKEANKSDEVKEDDKVRNQSRNSVKVKCPNCNKELQAGGLRQHLNNNRCKNIPADVPAS